MVNTFLPFADFEKSAQVLDYRRLGKQRVEARQIINVLENPDAKGWKNHPAVKMWRGHVPALKMYFNAMVTEWISRGYKNTMPLYDEVPYAAMPWWFGRAVFHGSHRAALMRKNTEFYTGKFEVSDKCLNNGYVWPKILAGYKIIKFSPITQYSK